MVWGGIILSVISGISGDFPVDGIWAFGRMLCIVMKSLEFWGKFMGIGP